MLMANKQLNRGTKTQKHKKEPKQRHMTYAQGNKEKEAKNLNQGFQAEVYVHLHKPACAERIMCAQTHPQKP